MTRHPWLAAALVAIGPATAGFGQAPGPPAIFGVQPPGATVGHTETWRIQGRNFEGATAMVVAGGGVEVLDFKAEPTLVTATVRVAKDATTGYRDVRIDGPNGLSNLAIVRLDHLPESAEVEPNDDPSRAQEVAEGSVVVGRLLAADLDHFKVRGTPGRRLTFDLEARRLGSPIAPVMTIFGPSGTAIAQGRESRSKDRDCRMSLVMPAEGYCVVQVRDNVYAGSEASCYRLRVDPAPFATGIFPLGGRAGELLEVEVSGGCLAKPVLKKIKLPDHAGGIVDVGLVDGPDGSFLVPGRVVASAATSLIEPADRPQGSAIDVVQGILIDGRIGRPEEVDAYRLPVKAGERVRVKVEASAMGSWLDSVVMIRDASGVTLAENDDSVDAVAPDQARRLSRVGVAQGSADSSIEYEAKADGVLSIEVSDRFGEGGPEYAYRLAIGPPRPDFSVTVLMGSSAGAPTMNAAGQPQVNRASVGQQGVLNLKPGATVPVNFLISPEGRPGPVTVTIKGLPEGVTAETVTIRMPGPLKPGETPGPGGNPSAVADLMLLKVSSSAEAGLSEIRVVASASPEPGLTIVREGMIGMDISPDPSRPNSRVTSRIPLRVLSGAGPKFVGPPSPPGLRKVTVPGPLLIGEQIVLGLDFANAISADDGSSLDARAEGVGLAANTIISAGTTANEDDSSPEAIVHLLASAKAEPGPHKVVISYKPSGSTTRMVREVTVDVRAPIEVSVAAGAIFLSPGDSASFRVDIRREPGADGEVEIKLDGLPRGVKGPKLVAIGAGMVSTEVKLEMAATAKPIAKAVEMRVVGVARMSRGNVSVEAKVRPMIGPKPADN